MATQVKSERLTVAVTPEEKKAVEKVARVRGVDVSTLLYEHVREIVAERDRMVAELLDAAA